MSRGLVHSALSNSNRAWLNISPTNPCSGRAFQKYPNPAARKQPMLGLVEESNLGMLRGSKGSGTTTPSKSIYTAIHSLIWRSYSISDSQFPLPFPNLELGTLLIPVLAPPICDNDTTIDQTLSAPSVLVPFGWTDFLEHHTFNPGLGFISRALNLRGFSRWGVDWVGSVGYARSFDSTMNEDSEGGETSDYYCCWWWWH